MGGLVEAAHARVARLEPQASALEAAATGRVPGRRFADALRAGGAVAVLGEIKRRSPSRGGIAPGLNAADQAAAYARGGAAAISVLTEPDQFGGAITDLDAARGAGVPLLRKDFIVDRLQIVEAAAHGAAAILLIVRALPEGRLADLHAAADALGLDVLVEVHTDRELEIALALGAPVIGVNNRDLETLGIDASACERLLPRVPAERLAVYESGVRVREDVERAARCGADAVLVGTMLSSSLDPEAAVRALTGVSREGRGR